MRIERVCEHCGEAFIARTTVTRFCGDTCAKRAYKARIRNKKIEKSNQETIQVKLKPLEDLKAKEFLKVSEVAQLIGCSVRTTYRLVNNGKIKAVNLSEKMTRIKRSEIDKLFE